MAISKREYRTKEGSKDDVSLPRESAKVRKVSSKLHQDLVLDKKYKAYDGENGSVGARYSTDATSNSSDKVWDSLRKVTRSEDAARDV